MVGLAIAIVLGMLFAIVMSQAKWIERSLFPYAVVLQTIPILALVPLIGFWFEFNFRSRVIVCVLIALFPIINNTLFGSAVSRPGPARPLHAPRVEPLHAPLAAAASGGRCPRSSRASASRPVSP